MRRGLRGGVVRVALLLLLLLVVVLAVAVLLATLAPTRRSYYDAARTWGEQVVELLDFDGDDGTNRMPLFDGDAGALAAGAARLCGVPPSAPCAVASEPVRNGSWRLAQSAAGLRLLAAYVQVHERQLRLLRDGSSRFRGLVYRCTADNAQDGCGGLGDRLNGIVSAFYLAVLTQRAFFIEHTTPLPLSVFFDPALAAVNWTWPPDGWAAHPRRANVGEIVAMNVYRGLERDLRVPGSNPLLALNAHPTVLVVRTNLQFWMGITASGEYVHRSPLDTLVQPVRAAGELFAVAVTALLHPSCYLAQETAAWETRLFGHVKEAAANDGGPRIGVHLRTGLDPSFQDYHRLLSDDLAPFTARVPGMVANLTARLASVGRSNTSSSPTVFVVSDDMRALDLVLRALRASGVAVVTVPHTGDAALPLTHLERSNATVLASPAGNLRTFLEWNLLRRMDAHILGVSGYSMSVSRLVCAPLLVYPSITASDADLEFHPKGLCWPQERPPSAE